MGNQRAFGCCGSCFWVSGSHNAPSITQFTPTRGDALTTAEAAVRLQLRSHLACWLRRRLRRRLRWRLRRRLRGGRRGRLRRRSDLHAPPLRLGARRRPGLSGAYPVARLCPSLRRTRLRHRPLPRQPLYQAAPALSEQTGDLGCVCGGDAGGAAGGGGDGLLPVPAHAHDRAQGREQPHAPARSLRPQLHRKLRHRQPQLRLPLRPQHQHDGVPSISRRGQDAAREEARVPWENGRPALWRGGHPRQPRARGAGPLPRRLRPQR